MKICLVCSHGGHLTELLQLMDAFKDHNIFFMTYDSPRTRELQNAYLFKNFGAKPIRFLTNLVRIIRILITEKPGMIISTGAEIAIPVFYLAKIFGIKLIFIESWCRVYEPSTTGKLIYPIADLFLVQWEPLLKKYGKRAKYHGGVL